MPNSLIQEPRTRLMYMGHLAELFCKPSARIIFLYFYSFSTDESLEYEASSGSY